MQRTTRWMLGGGAAVATAAALLLVPGQLALSADHFDPPARVSPRITRTTTPDIAADIADVFAFTDANNVFFAVTFHNSAAASGGSPYDRNVLHVLNISTDGTTPAARAIPEIRIRWRYGTPTNGTGAGVQVAFEDLRSGGGLASVGTLVGPVEDLSNPGPLTRSVALPGGGTGTIRAYAGLRDDPFFFDLVGFENTRAVGSLQFDRTRNFFRNANGVVLIVQIPKPLLGAGPIDTFATTARFGGFLP